MLRKTAALSRVVGAHVVRARAFDKVSSRLSSLGGVAEVYGLGFSASTAVLGQVHPAWRWPAGRRQRLIAPAGTRRMTSGLFQESCPGKARRPQRALYSILSIRRYTLTHLVTF